MLKELINNFLEFLAPFIALITFLFVMTKRKVIPSLYPLLAYFIVSSINLGSTSYLAFIDTPNVLWYNINGFSSLLLLSWFFYGLLQSSRNKRLVLWMTAAGLISYILLLLWDDGIMFFSSGYLISSLLIIVYSLVFLREFFMRPDIENPTDEATLWIVSGIMTYYLGAYVINVAFKLATKLTLSQNVEDVLRPGFLWGIHNVIYFLVCVFISINVFKLNRMPSRNDSGVASLKPEGNIEV